MNWLELNDHKLVVTAMTRSMDTVTIEIHDPGMY